MSTFRKKFRFREERLEYDLKLRKKFPWWILLFLLLPLLLLIQFQKSILITTVDPSGDGIAGATVELSYTEYQLFKNGKLFYSHRHHYILTSDEDGEALFEHLPSGVFSLVCHPFLKARASAAYRIFEDSGEFLFNFKKQYVLEMDGDMTIEVKDASTMEPLPDVNIKLKLSDPDRRELDFNTDNKGKVVFPLKSFDAVIDTLFATKPGYSGKVLVEKPCDPDYHLVLYIDKARKCGETVNNETRSDKNDIIQYDMGQDGGTFRFYYYTDSEPDLLEVYEGTTEDYANGKAKLLFHYHDATNNQVFRQFEDITFSGRNICVVYLEESYYWGYRIDCPQ